MIPDDCVIMEQDLDFELPDGTTLPHTLPITAGMVRSWQAKDSAGCECQFCINVRIEAFPRAAAVYELMEEYAAGRLTHKALQRKMKRLGFIKREEAFTLQ